MKIDYYHSAPIPSTRANSVNVVRTCNAFKKEGCDISLFAAKGEGSTADIFRDYGVVNAFPITRITVPETRFVGSTTFRAFAAYHILRRRSFVFTRDISVAYIAGLLGRPFAYEMHVLPRKAAQKKMLGQVVKSPHLKRFISISNSLHAQLLSTYRVENDGRFVIVPLGADVDMESAQIGAEDHPPASVGYVGHLYPGKGEEIIRGLAERLPGLRFEIIGRAGGLAEGAPANIQLHGILPHVQAMRRLRQFDITLAPYQVGSSDFAGVDISSSFSPLKIFEYMAAGKPIVCSDLPVLREILTDGVNALLAPPADIDAWVRAIERLIGDGALRAALAREALETLRSTYSYDVRAKRMLAEFA